MPKPLLLLVAPVLLASCGSDEVQPSKADLQSVNYWSKGMKEADSRMTKAARSSSRGNRHTESTASWNSRSGLDEGTPTDAPEAGWANK